MLECPSICVWYFPHVKIGLWLFGRKITIWSMFLASVSFSGMLSIAVSAHTAYLSYLKFFNCELNNFPFSLLNFLGKLIISSINLGQERVNFLWGNNIDIYYLKSWCKENLPHCTHLFLQSIIYLCKYELKYLFYTLYYTSKLPLGMKTY